MHKTTKRIVFLIALMFAYVGCAELVYDQDFDSNNTGWIPEVTGTTVASYITDGVAGDTTRSGTGALSISNPVTSQEKWSLDKDVSVESYVPAVIPKQEYELTAWVKTENMNANTVVYTRIAWRKSDLTYISLSDLSPKIKTDGDWTRLTLTATSPSGAGGASLILNVQANDTNSTATVTFDDVQLTAVPDLVYDQDLDDNNTSWSPVVTGGTVATYITNGIAGDTTYSGTGALSISNPESTQEQWYLDKDASVVIYDHVILPEQEYELTAWVKTENMNGNTVVYTRIAWRNLDKVFLGLSDVSPKIKTDGDWTRLTLNATSPVDAGGASLILNVQANNTNSTATVTFDDIQLDAVEEPVVPASLAIFCDGVNIEVSSEELSSTSSNVLEMAKDLSADDWSAVSYSTGTNSSTWVLPFTNTAAFYRVLARPLDQVLQWTTSWPDVTLADAGFDTLANVNHSTIFSGSQEVGMYNHGPRLGYHHEKAFVVWYSHDAYERAAGTRTLFSFSADLETWSEPTVLFDSIGEMAGVGVNGTCVLYATLEEVNDRLYSIALVAEITEWNDDYTPSVDRHGYIARRVYDDGTFGEHTFWLLNEVPSAYVNEDMKSYLQAEDATELTDLTELKTIREERETRYAVPNTEDEGVTFAEPTYFTRPDGTEVGIFRDLSEGLRLYSAVRNKATDEWSPAEQTNIPDSPSRTASGVFADGSVFIVGNFLDQLWLRDPLLFATSEDGIHFSEAFVLRAGAPDATERNQYDRKGPGYQYPDAVVTDDSVWVTYSVSKEQIAISRIPLEVLGQ
jgi:hypothetical protein